jgi:hypothetical protein
LRSFEIPNQSDESLKLFFRVSLKGFCPVKTRRQVMCKIRWTVMLVMVSAIIALSGCQSGKSLLKTENEVPQLSEAALPNYMVGEYFTFDDDSSRMVAAVSGEWVTWQYKTRLSKFYHSRSNLDKCAQAQ